MSKIMSEDREALEKLALKTVSPDYYYDLADVIYDTPNCDLWSIIECKGDYNKELKLSEGSK